MNFWIAYEAHVAAMEEMAKKDQVEVLVKEYLGRENDHEYYGVEIPRRAGIQRVECPLIIWIWISDDLRFIAGDMDRDYLVNDIIPYSDNWSEIGLDRHAEVSV